MNRLERLRELQDEILRAEFTALLHNIGKLDPIFLASKAKDKEKVAEYEVKSNGFGIKDYHFKCFAAPDLSLLNDDVRSVLTMKIWSDIIDFAEELKTHFPDDLIHRAVGALIMDWKPGKANPIMAKAIKEIEAIWQFYRFTLTNGSLYRCLVSKRQDKLSPLKIEYEKAKAEFETFNIQSVPQAEINKKRNELKQAKGRAESNLKKASEEISEEINTEEKRHQKETETKFREIKLTIAGEIWSIADFLSLFWDDFFYQPEGNGYLRESALARWLTSRQTTKLPAMLMLSHGEVSGSEKDFKIQSENNGENEEKSKLYGLASPTFHNFRFATAFGFDHKSIQHFDLPKNRHSLLGEALDALRSPTQKRAQFIKTARTILEGGLGDTQWPINEINLWDYSSTIATLFKSCVAKAVIEDRLPELIDIRWRLLSLRYDGLSFLSQAQRISDLLARRDILNKSLDAVQIFIDAERPLGNEVYRDENGSVLIVPNITEGGEEIDLLSLPSGSEDGAENIERLLINRFANSDEQNSLTGEILPVIALSGPLKGADIRLTEVADWAAPGLFSDAKQIEQQWPNSEITGELCTVCGVRMQGQGKRDWETHFTERHKVGEEPRDCQVCKAQDRNVCQICERRRSDRSQAWATNLENSSVTIWIDEVADVDRRIALITGKFELDDWLNGNLIKTMKKTESFARIRRIWETTRNFWQEIKTAPDDRRRLKIQISGKPDLGAYHVYDLKLGPTDINLVWVPPEDGGYFISADNFCYAAKRLGAEREIYVDSAAAAIYVEDYIIKHFIDGCQEPVLINPDATETRQRNLIAGHSISMVSYQKTAYSTTIPILAEPRTFMALVPADKALDVIKAIKTKYEREMGKVRNRLPLHLGAVYFHRRTPLRAALDAGRRMLHRKSANENQVWVVDENISETPDDKKNALGEGNQHFEKSCTVTLKQNGREIHWHVPLKMGDGETDDDWYPYVFIQSDVSGRLSIFKAPRPNGDGTTEECWLVHADELKKGDKIYFTPSTFDFEWLDTSARRFEIAYDETGKRLGRLTRPYLLDELDEIRRAWALISGEKGLSKSQIYALRDSVEARRESWNASSQDEKETFQRFCREAILNAAWKKTPSRENIESFVAWTANGLLADVIELYMGVMKEKTKQDKAGEENS